MEQTGDLICFSSSEICRNFAWKQSLDKGQFSGLERCHTFLDHDISAFINNAALFRDLLWLGDHLPSLLHK
jgi:hypothetical protein